MNKDIRLDLQATSQVIDDLIMAGLASKCVVHDRASGVKGVTITWPKDGTKVIAGYAEALGAIRKPTQRKIKMLVEIIGTNAAQFLDETGRGG